MSTEKQEYTISFKVSGTTKLQYDQLTKEQKKDLHYSFRTETAKAIHMAKFSRKDILGDES